VDDRRQRRWKWTSWPGVLALYSLLTVLLTYPIAFRAATELPYYTDDIWILLWDNWWLRKVLFDGQSFFSTPFLFYPQGAGLASHSTCLTMSLLATALRPLGGDLFAYNVAVLSIFPIGALGAYLLVVELTGRRDAAFIAGLVYAFAPYHLTHALGHPHLASVQWMPYTALFLSRLLREGRPRDALGAGVTFALTLWSGLHLASLFGLWAGAFVAFTLATERGARRRGVWISLGIAALVVAVSSLPILRALLAEWRQVGGMGSLLYNRRETGQTDLLAYVVPPHLNPFWGRLVEPAYALFLANLRWIPYLGFLPLALALAASLHRRREAFFWWASGLLWIVLSLGSILRVGGRVYPGIRLPFDLLDARVFPFNTLRYADRFNILVPLSLAVLVGMGIALLHRRAAVALAGLVIATEYLCIPIPMRAPRPIPPFLQAMREDGERYAVVDFPIGEWCAKRWMYQQTVHEKPLVDGHVSRLAPSTYAFIDGVPLLRAVRLADAPPPHDAAADLCRLAASGVRYVLVHPEFATAQELGRWLSWMPTRAIYRDESLIVYTTADGCDAADVTEAP
jgi:hypothetical protein